MLKRHKELSGLEREHFAEVFLEKFLQSGFGTLPKREIEILVFHLLSETEAFRELTTYQLSNELTISDARIRTLRSEAALRYNQVEHRQALLELSRIFFEYGETRVALEDDEVMFELEDPRLQREFEEAARRIGYFADASYRREILRVKAHVFVAVFSSVFGEVEENVTRIVKGDEEKRAGAEKIVEKAMPLGARVEKFLERHKGKIGLVKDLLSPLKLIAGA